MKVTVFLIASFLGLAMMSCDKGEMAPQELIEFEDVMLSAARYSAEADSTTKAKCKGKLTQIATADIPAAITEYIAANYEGATVKFAGADEAGVIVVGLALADGKHLGLLFDKTGAFKAELKRYGKKAKLTEVAVADLPGTISSYVATTYGSRGAEIKRAGTNEEGQYFVMLTIEDKPLVLLFAADGTFVKEIEKPMKRGKKLPPSRK